MFSKWLAVENISSNAFNSVRFIVSKFLTKESFSSLSAQPQKCVKGEVKCVFLKFVGKLFG